MIVAGHVPGGEAGASADARRVDGAADGDEPLHDFLEQAANDLRLAALVVAGHEGTHQSACRHAAEATALFGENHPRAMPRRRNGGAHARRTSAADEDIGFEAC